MQTPCLLSMKKLLRNNGLSLVLFSLFLAFWALQSWAGYLVDQKERSKHGQAPTGYAVYLCSGHFWQATGENWESEFLQMGIYVFFSSFLFQRGSAESKDPDKGSDCDEPVERHANDPGAPAALRKGKAVRWLYQYSLGLAFLLLFVVSMVLHARGGYDLHKEEALRNGEPPGSFGQFLADAEFWFQSMQNWQSEFLAVFSIVVLSIWLRHHASPESKCVWASHHKTGKE